MGVNINAMRGHYTRSLEGDLELASKIGTFTAMAMVRTVTADLDYYHTMAVWAFAHILDVKQARNERLIVYPREVAEVFGCRDGRMADYLREVARTTKLVGGTSQAGYSPGSDLAH